MKAERRQEAKSMRANSGPRQPGDVDPDIAGIVPGPQPPREDMLLDEEPEPEPEWFRIPGFLFLIRER